MQIVNSLINRQPDAKLLVHAMLEKDDFCSKVRITEPNFFLSKIAGVKVIEERGQVVLTKEEHDIKKIFIWQRMFPYFNQLLSLFQKQYLVLLEVDDHPERVRMLAEKERYLGLEAYHAVQVSTKNLANYIKKFNPYVKIFPNLIANLPMLKEKEKRTEKRLFFAAFNRQLDWQEIMPELNLILNYYKKRLFVDVIYDELFFDSLKTPYKTFAPMCSYAQYSNIMSNADIALLPLLPTKFNLMKSDLKFLECASNGIAVLASPTVYAETIQNEKTGCVYYSKNDFGKYLVKLIENDDFYEEIRKEAYLWVKYNRLLCNHYLERYQWYLEMYEKLPILNEEAYKRCKLLNLV